MHSQGEGGFLFVLFKKIFFFNEGNGSGGEKHKKYHSDRVFRNNIATHTILYLKVYKEIFLLFSFVFFFSYCFYLQE